MSGSILDLGDIVTEEFVFRELMFAKIVKLWVGV